MFPLARGTGLAGWLVLWPLCSAAGGEHASDLDILRSAPGVFGQLPSNATVSRFFERTVANPELFSYGFETLTRELRTRAWDAAGDRNPALAATAADPLIIDLDATLVTSHSTGMGTGSLAESSLWPRHIGSFLVS